MTAIDVAQPTTGQLDRPRAGRSDAVQSLIALAGDLERLGYPYEAYQLRQGAARLLRDLAKAG